LLQLFSVLKIVSYLLFLSSPPYNSFLC
jgi:hypothetical protein